MDPLRDRRLIGVLGLLGVLLPCIRAQDSDRHEGSPRTTELTARLPEGVRVVYSLSGSENDRLGVGLASLDDIDADGTRDFALGASSFDVGYVLFVSGRSGTVLSRVDQPHDASGDEFGAVIAAVGDTDGDGVEDLAVGAARWWNGRGYAAVYSGGTRELLYSIYGAQLQDEPPCVLVRELPTSRDDDDFFFYRAIGGSFVPAGDVDGDERADFFANGWLISGNDGRPLRNAEGRVLGLTGDLDADGHRDLLTFRSLRRNRFVEIGPVSRQDRYRRVPLHYEGEQQIEAVEDHDSDEFRDFVVATEEDGGPDAQGGHRRRVRVRVVDGLAGRVLLEWTQSGSSRTGDHQTKPIGDVDGDGAVDFATRTGPNFTPSAAWIVIRSGRDGRELFTLSSDSRMFGSQFEGIGDVDGDGRSDLLISDCGATTSGARAAGVAYVLAFPGG